MDEKAYCFNAIFQRNEVERGFSEECLLKLKKITNFAIVDNETFIEQHRDEDVRRLALRKAPDGVDLKWCLQQIEGWQLARKKIPRWANTEGLWYPQRLSMEQCSSEQTAEYKRYLVKRLIPEGERQSMADLTGGLGVDFAAMAPLFAEATYVEILPELRRLAEHNMPLVGIKNEKLKIKDPSHLSPKSHLSPITSHLSLTFLDPARRDGAGRKTVRIEDCTPNLIELQDELLTQSQWLIAKLSPMLDISLALRQLKGVREIHVVSVQGECKELLFVASREPQISINPTIFCVNLGTEEDVVIMKSGENEKMTHLSPITSHLNFLYEPNASVLKADVQDILCKRYGVSKLHPKSNLFVGTELIPHFPGRGFRIVGSSDFSKQGLKTLIGDLRQANLAIRNFPTPVATLRRQLKLAEGGDAYLFATTCGNGQHILIRCEKGLLEVRSEK